MAGDIVKPELHGDIVFSLVIDGDLSKLSNEQVLGYYYHRCELLGLDPGEKPFDLLKLDGKKVLYTTKAGAAALTRVNQLSVEIKNKGWDGDFYVVEARASTPSGRFVDNIGVIDMAEERERALANNKRCITPANAMMKAVTKAERRAILGCSGCGLLDVSELESIRGAQRLSIEQLEQPPQAEDVDPLMTGKLASKAAKAMARCAKIAAAKSTDDKLVTPRDVWEAACGKFRLAPTSDGGTPRIESLRKSIAFPICDLIKKWEAKLEPLIEREPGDDRDVDEEPIIDVEYASGIGVDVDPLAKGAP